MVNEALPKRERMVSRKLIDSLFGGGSSSSMAAYPLRAVYMTRERAEGESPVQILISVPKKRFKHAVDRNRVKRQVREAYRHHKALLYNALTDHQQLLLAFVWLSPAHLPSHDVESRIVSLLHRIGEKLNTEHLS
jgi:ribonuclease P protein component